MFPTAAQQSLWLALKSSEAKRITIPNTNEKVDIMSRKIEMAISIFLKRLASFCFCSNPTNIVYLSCFLEESIFQRALSSTSWLSSYVSGSFFQAVQISEEIVSSLEHLIFS